MKVWLLADVLLAEHFTNNNKRVPAGTCLFIAENQTWCPPGTIAVYGGGVFDVVRAEWLTYDASIAPAPLFNVSPIGDIQS